MKESPVNYLTMDTGERAEWKELFIQHQNASGVSPWDE